MPTTNGLFDGTIALLQRSLNLRSAQHQALSTNIANADTPGFKAFEVVVDEELRKQQGAARRLEPVRTSGTHMPPAAAGTTPVRLRPAAGPGFSLRADGNTVDLDRSMGALSENAIKYKTSAQLISAKLKSLRNVIVGGR